MCVSVETVFKNGVVVHSQHWNIMVIFVGLPKKITPLNMLPRTIAY